MIDQTCQVTVVGTKNQADVVLPAQAPISAYVSSLATVVGERDNEAMPAVWSLREAGLPPLAPYESIASAGVTDGKLLYLCDLTEGEYDEPVLLEADELVHDTLDRVGGPRCAASTAVAITFVASAVWVVAALGWWLIRYPHDTARLGAAALAAGACLCAVAWAGRSRRLGIARALRLVLAVSAVPCLGLAGWCVGVNWPGIRPGATVAVAITGITAGAVAGTMAAVAVVPGLETTALAGLALASCPAICLLLWSGAVYREVAAVAAVAGYLLILVVPALAHWSSALWAQIAHERSAERRRLRARRLTLAGTSVGSVATAIGLVLASAARNNFDLGLVAVLSCALLLRVGPRRLLAEAVPLIVAGLAGLFSLTVEAPQYWGLGDLDLALARTGLGLAVMLLGLILTLRHPAARRPVTGADVTGRSVWLRMAMALCLVAIFPLLEGTFGLYGRLVIVGHGL